MQRNTITLPDFGARETNQTGSVGRPSFVLPREVIENLRARCSRCHGGQFIGEYESTG